MSQEITLSNVIENKDMLNYILSYVPSEAIASLFAVNKTFNLSILQYFSSYLQSDPALIFWFKKSPYSFIFLFADEVRRRSSALIEISLVFQTDKAKIDIKVLMEKFRNIQARFPVEQNRLLYLLFLHFCSNQNTFIFHEEITILFKHIEKNEKEYENLLFDFDKDFLILCKLPGSYRPIEFFRDFYAPQIYRKMFYFCDILITLRKDNNKHLDFFKPLLSFFKQNFFFTQRTEKVLDTIIDFFDASHDSRLIKDEIRLFQNKLKNVCKSDDFEYTVKIISGISILPLLGVIFLTLGITLHIGVLVAIAICIGQILAAALFCYLSCSCSSDSTKEKQEKAREEEIKKADKELYKATKPIFSQKNIFLSFFNPTPSEQEQKAVIEDTIVNRYNSPEAEPALIV